MQFQLFLRMALLLASAQVIFGAAGYALRQYPAPALVVFLLFVWFLMRTAVVMREEVARAQRRGISVVPAAAAGLVAVFWQLPGIAVLPVWAPRWLWLAWQGWVLPLPGLLGRLLGTELSLTPWVWGACGAEVLLFMWQVSHQRMRPMRRPAVQRPKPAGDVEWVPAIRYQGEPRQETEALPKRGSGDD